LARLFDGLPNNEVRGAQEAVYMLRCGLRRTSEF
jgi:hypothetical protein